MMSKSNFSGVSGGVNSVCYLILALTIAALVWLITDAGNGQFLYNLDDPYIHLSMSEQISRGGYGINPGEYASASSSILFPFLLAPFASAAVHQYVPLIINIAALFLSFEFLRRYFQKRIFSGDLRMRGTAAVFALLTVLALNIFALAFIGMEHSLQVLATVMCLYALIGMLEGEPMPWWLPLMVVVMPLLRYEGLSLSLIALVVMIKCGYWRGALATFLVMIVLLAGFSFFLLGLGLEFLPGSVLVKAHIRLGETDIVKLLGNGLAKSLRHPRGLMLLEIAAMTVLGMGLAAYKKKAINTPEFWAGLILLGIALGHILFGEYHGFARYEIYAFVAALLLGAYLLRPVVERLIVSRGGRIRLRLWFVILLAALGGSYIVGPTADLIAASRNIYEQPFQVARFVRDFHQADVAANDIGLISYRNEDRVFDVVGLANRQARQIHHGRDFYALLKTMAQQQNIKLAILHKEILPSNIPDNWRQLAVLHLSAKNLILAHPRMYFFATAPEYAPVLQEKLRRFAATLPENVVLKLDKIK